RSCRGRAELPLKLDWKPGIAEEIKCRAASFGLFGQHAALIVASVAGHPNMESVVVKMGRDVGDAVKPARIHVGDGFGVNVLQANVEFVRDSFNYHRDTAIHGAC